MDMDFFFLTRDDTTDADTVRTDSSVRISAAHNNTCKAVVRFYLFGGLDSLDSGLHCYHRIALPKRYSSVVVIADCGRSVRTTRPSVFLYPTNWRICSPCLERTDCRHASVAASIASVLTNFHIYMYSTRLCEIIDSIRSRWCVVLFLSSLGR